jgi:hypothetical protein
MVMVMGIGLNSKEPAAVRLCDAPARPRRPCSAPSRRGTSADVLVLSTTPRRIAAALGLTTDHQGSCLLGCPAR